MYKGLEGAKKSSQMRRMGFEVRDGGKKRSGQEG